MLLLFYSRNEIGPGKKLQDVMKGLRMGNELEIHHDLDSFSSSLRKPMRRQFIVILFVENNEDFSDLFLIKKLLMDLSIIFIVPDRTQDTLSKAHCFFPRFITSTEYAFDDVKVVLERMILNKKKEEKSGFPELINNEFETCRSQKPDVTIG